MLILGGTILGIINNKAIVQHTDAKPNRNVMVVGGPGSFKTQSYVITNVLNETDTSIVITDPKGEVFEMTSAIKEAQGYEVHVLNYTNMAKSDRHNPLDYVRKETEATTVATKIVDASNADGKKDVWYLSQRALLKALILYVVNELEPAKRNMRGLLEFFQSFSIEQDEDGISELDEKFLSLSFDHPARKAYELGFKKAKGDMQGSIVMSLLSTVSDYVDSEVAEFTSFSDFHLTDIGNKKIALYVIIPVMDHSWEGLINLFFSQLFNELYAFAAMNHSKLPQPITFILDEFVNLGKFEGYEEFLATCRGYGIGVSTIIQTLTQLQDKYGEKKAESILGNCAVKICLNAANDTTATYFCKLLNKTTVKIDTESVSQQHGKEQNSSSTSESESYIGRDLMTNGEILGMKEDTSLIIIQAKPPIKAKKAFQFELFPGATDFDLRNQHLYTAKPSKQQIEDFEKKQASFLSTVIDKETEKEEKLKALKEQREIEKEQEIKEQEEIARSFFGMDSQEEETIEIENNENIEIDLEIDNEETQEVKQESDLDNRKQSDKSEVMSDSFELNL